MSTDTQVWHVMTGDGVYEADTETLKQWVIDGRIRPTDKVSKGSLRWIEADRAPMLRGIFYATEPPQNVSAAAGATAAASAERAHPAAQSHRAPATSSAAFTGNGLLAPHANSAACYYHAAALPEYICRVCAATFCKDCPNFVGGSRVPLCKLCGDLCRPYEEERKKAAQRTRQSSGFGIEDFGRALAYPFAHIISLIFGAILYGILLLAGFKGHLLASAILFGCMALVINHVAAGRTVRDFMPDFSEFSLWDDLVLPLFLGLGVWVVTLGPSIVLIAAVFFGWLSGGPSSPLDLAQTPGAAAPQQSPLSQEDWDAIINSDGSEKEAAAMRKIRGLHPAGQITSQIEKADQSTSMISFLTRLINIPRWVIITGLLTVCWAIFYYPMALTVAGYTENFWSVVNPLVGLDTIRRMGAVYAKAFFMYLGVQIVGIALSIPVAAVTAPFDLPLVGNLPSTFINGMVTFYTSLVIACLLGLALYKCAGRLNILTD